MAATKLPDPLDFDDDMTAPLGFSANLNAQSLSDLVQMECLSGAACVARVSSGDEVGYLYFRAGRIVHAMSSSSVGEAAALEILGWSSGTFELCNAGWPESESIQGNFQSLLLRAAQARDESGRRNLLPFPRSKDEPSRTPRPARVARNEGGDPPPPISRELGRPSPQAQPPTQASAGPASGVARAQAAARLDATGKVLSLQGSGAEELADAMALASRLGGLLGESLGLERLIAIEGTSATQRTLVVIEASGGALGVRAPLDADLTTVRERYGI